MSLPTKEIKSFFTNLSWKAKNKIIQKIIETDEDQEISKFMRTTKKYMGEADTNKDYTLGNKSNEIKEKLYKLDERLWKEELNSKTSLKTYQEFKNAIKAETGIYDNSEASHILFKARTNTLRLN